MPDELSDSEMLLLAALEDLRNGLEALVKEQAWLVSYCEQLSHEAQEEIAGGETTRSDEPTPNGKTDRVIPFPSAAPGT